MRTMIILAMSLASAVAAADQAPPIEVPRTLTADEVERYIQPYAFDIGRCYLTSAVGGKLELDLIIHRDGTVFHVDVITLALAPRAARKVDRCIRKLAPTWHFPVRNGFTNASVPFEFVRTDAPGAGPQPSCWSPRGCPDRRRPRRIATR